MVTFLVELCDFIDVELPTMPQKVAILDHFDCTRGWLSRLAGGKPPPEVGFGTWSPKRRTENQAKARWLRPANAGPSTGPEKPQYRPACGRA